MYNVLDSVKQQVFPDGNVKLSISRRNNERWVVYIKVQYAHETAKLEFLVEDVEDDPDVAASVIRYGSVSQSRIAMFMDGVVEQLVPDDQTSASE